MTLLPPIAYLRADDFLPDGSFKTIDVTTKPAFVLFQSNGCPACAEVKPMFQKLANAAQRTQFLTVQLDGTDPGERALTARQRGGGPSLIDKIAPNLQHIPTFILYTRHGNYEYKRGGAESIEAFLTRHGGASNNPRARG
jgi:thiol-disulfide isomerase/thioredoxin